MTKRRNPWAWVPSLYFAEGLPNAVVTILIVAFFTTMDMDVAQITFYTGWLALPWVIKPLWSPFVDIIKTKRWWILATQFLMGVGLAALAFFIPTHFYIQATLALGFLIAFTSATHDIVADGFYLLELDKSQQSFFVGIRSTFYRLAVIFVQGGLVILAGYLAKRTGDNSLAWMITFLITAGLFLLFYGYHRFILPRPKSDMPNENKGFREIIHEFALTFKTFFSKPNIGAALFFLLTYRIAEAQVQVLKIPFLHTPVAEGGLGLDMMAIGQITGIYGMIGMVAGGIIGGVLAARGGVRRWLWPMMLTMLLTSAVYIYLAYVQPGNLFIINLCIVIEEFGYGFGFTAYMLFMMYFAEGRHKTTHYALCTGFMAAGLMIPKLPAGWILNQLGGYTEFYIYIMICSIVPVLAASLLKLKGER